VKRKDHNPRYPQGNKVRQWLENLRKFRLPFWMANKYFIVGLAFAVFVFFFDSFNIVERVKLSRQLRQSREELSYYNTEIVEIKRQLDELLVNDATAEKFARERYLMKRENEDVFVIMEK